MTFRDNNILYRIAVYNLRWQVYIGGREHTTVKELSEALGKETISMYTESVTRGMQESHGQNLQRLGKDMPYLFVKSSVAHKIHGQGHDQSGFPICPMEANLSLIYLNPIINPDIMEVDKK